MSAFHTAACVILGHPRNQGGNTPQKTYKSIALNTTVGHKPPRSFLLQTPLKINGSYTFPFIRWELYPDGANAGELADGLCPLFTIWTTEVIHFCCGLWMNQNLLFSPPSVLQEMEDANLEEIPE